MNNKVVPQLPPSLETEGAFKSVYSNNCSITRVLGERQSQIFVRVLPTSMKYSTAAILSFSAKADCEITTLAGTLVMCCYLTISTFAENAIMVEVENYIHVGSIPRFLTSLDFAFYALVDRFC